VTGAAVHRAKWLLVIDTLLVPAEDALAHG
jgi:hypothetical protein